MEYLTASENEKEPSWLDSSGPFETKTSWTYAVHTHSDADL